MLSLMKIYKIITQNSNWRLILNKIINKEVNLFFFLEILLIIIKLLLINILFNF